MSSLSKSDRNLNWIVIIQSGLPLWMCYEAYTGPNTKLCIGIVMWMTHAGLLMLQLAACKRILCAAVAGLVEIALPVRCIVDYFRLYQETKAEPVWQAFRISVLVAGGLLATHLYLLLGIMRRIESQRTEESTAPSDESEKDESELV